MDESFCLSCSHLRSGTLHLPSEGGGSSIEVESCAAKVSTRKFFAVRHGKTGKSGKIRFPRCLFFFRKE